MTAPNRVTVKPNHVEFIDFVRAELAEDLTYRQWSRADTLAWILEDFMFHPPDVPAFGRMSPVMAGIVRKFLERAS